MTENEIIARMYELRKTYGELLYGLADRPALDEWLKLHSLLLQTSGRTWSEYSKSEVESRIVELVVFYGP